MRKTFLVTLLILSCFQQLTLTSGLYEPIASKNKVKLVYICKDKSQRTVIVKNQINRDLPGEQEIIKYSENSTVQFDETFRAGSKSKFSASLKFNNIELKTTKDGIEKLNINTENDMPERANLETKIAYGVLGNGIEYDVSTSGKISKPKSLRDFNKGVVRKVFRSSKKTEETEEATDFIEENYTIDYFTDILQSMYLGFTKSSLKINSTWKSKIYKIIENVGKIYFELNCELTKFENVDRNLIAEINYSANSDFKTKGNIVDKNIRLKIAEIEGSFIFNITKGAAVKSISTISAEYKQKIPVAEDEKYKIVKLSYKQKTEVVFQGTNITTGNPQVKLVTSMGDITLELFEDQAPNTVANFIELCESNFYNNLRFHRVIKDFMIQGGCPKSKGGVKRDAGTGDPGYRFDDEFDSKLVFDRKGILAMANSGPKTNGSQFFITLAPTKHLNGKHTIFGQVIDGMDVVEDIGNVTTYKFGSSSMPKGAPAKDVIIKQTIILKKRDHEYHVKKLN